MQRIKFVALSLILGMAFSVSLSAFSHSADEGTQTLQGNVVCLIPDYEKGTVKPVIASGPCDGLPPHEHVLVTKNTVYSVNQVLCFLSKFMTLMPGDLVITGTPGGIGISVRVPIPVLTSASTTPGSTRDTSQSRSIGSRSRPLRRESSRTNGGTSAGSNPPSARL